MIYLTIALFATAAVLGSTILIKWLARKDVPRGIVYSHGAAAATGLVLLIVYSLQHPENFPKVSILLFVIAAIGGFYMFINDIKKKTSPLAIAFIHATLAVTGFVTLLIFVFG